jgi:hypothetical protein
MSLLMPDAHPHRRIDALTGTARLLTAAVAPLSGSAASLQRASTDHALRSGWNGPAADAAARVLGLRAHGIASVARALDVASTSLTRAAGAVSAAGWRAARAAAAGPALLPALSLTGVAWVELELWESSAQAQAAGTTCAAVLQEAADRCRAVARGVGEPTARAVAFRSLGPARAAAWLAEVPQAGTSAEAVARWWAAHTPTERERLLGDPATAVSLGALDGLPATARDLANRTVLARRVAAWAGRVRGAADPPPSPQSEAAHRVDLRLLDELSRVRVDPLTGAAVPVLLLTYEPTAWDGRGRAAVAFGEPDQATNVAYVVPGFGVRIDPDLPSLAEGAWQLYATARRLVRPPTVATVAWLAYETPDIPEVAFEHRAQIGAERLAAQMAGLRAARGDDQPHVTVIGHSYGSVVAGLATRLVPGAVDDLAVIGSPGAGVDSADDLPVPTGHVWAGAASGDPVSHLSRFGVDPAAESFGAHRFPAESGVGVPLLVQHSQYLDAGSQSLAALARIVVGAGAEVPSAPGRTDSGYAGAATDLVIPPLLLGLVHRMPEPTFGDPAAG